VRLSAAGTIRIIGIIIQAGERVKSAAGFAAIRSALEPVASL